ncbi:hypothetical protein NKJ06_27440 [Mesorhizobium sp. M0293]
MRIAVAIECRRVFVRDGIPYREAHILDFLGRDLRDQAIVRIAGDAPERRVVHHPGMAVLVSTQVEFDTMEPMLEGVVGS